MSQSVWGHWVRQSRDSEPRASTISLYSIIEPLSMVAMERSFITVL